MLTSILQAAMLKNIGHPQLNIYGRVLFFKLLSNFVKQILRSILQNFQNFFCLFKYIWGNNIIDMNINNINRLSIMITEPVVQFYSGFWRGYSKFENQLLQVHSINVHQVHQVHSFIRCKTCYIVHKANWNIIQFWLSI